jgi:hypothetical protein
MITNTKFLKTLIDSDFSLLNQTNLKTSTLNSISVLNLSELQKELKQFLRLLTFISTNKNGSIIICVEDDYTSFLLTQIFADVSFKIKIQKTIPVEYTKKDQVKLILVFGTSHINFNRLLNSNIFLITKINKVYEKKLCGSYKISNDLSDLKKIVFLCILLNKILKKNS